jgi:anti-anti-sigma factor
VVGVFAPSPMRPTTFHLDTTGLDDRTAFEVTDYLIGLRPTALRLDLRRVEWIGSGALGMLIGLNRHVSGRLVLDNVSQPVADMLRLTRLDRVLYIRRPT